MTKYASPNLPSYVASKESPFSNERKTPEGQRVSEASFTSLLISFLRDTNAHGLPKIVTSTSKTKKVLWLAVFCTAFAYFVYQCTVLVNNYLSYPVSVQIDVTTSKKIAFPAVTVCNLNMLKRDEVAKDPKYRELVGIDNYYKYVVGSFLGSGTTSQRKRRDASRERPLRNEHPALRREDLIFIGSRLQQGRNQFDPKSPEKLILNALKLKYPEENGELRAGKAEKPTGSGRRDNKRKMGSNDPETPGGEGGESREKREADMWSGDSDGDYNWMSWYDDSGGMVANSSDYSDAYGGDYEDYGFVGKVANDYAFRQFAKLSKTDDYSDLVDVLKPSREDLDAYGHQASDFILQCSFNKKNCSYLDFRKIYNPTYGLCYVFNHAVGNTTVRKTNKFGSRYGLRLTLNIEYDQYIGMFSHKVGARIAVHHNNITAFPEDFGVNAGPGENTEIGISLETIHRQPFPYPTNCTTGDGYKLLYDGNYTVMACTMSCLQTNLRQKCGCTDRLIVNANESRCSVVNKTQETCRQRVYRLYDDNKLGCDCPPSCQEQIHKVSISSSDWPSTPYQYILISELIKAKQLSIDANTLSSVNTTLLGVHVYLETPLVVSIKEYPSYTWDRLLADIGGLLGLFIGVSACTVAEVFELMADASLLAVKILLAKRKGKVKQQSHQPMDGIATYRNTVNTGHC